MPLISLLPHLRGWLSPEPPPSRSNEDQPPESQPLELFRIACLLQDKGKSLSDDDRVAGAKRLYALGNQSKKEIAAVLGVTQSTVSKWLARTLRDERERKKNKALDMWQACYMQEEIAAAVEMTHQAIATWEDEFVKKFLENNFTNPQDFDTSTYNV